MNERILTGITTTGIPHLGNFLGAIKPALKFQTSIKPCLANSNGVINAIREMA